MVTSIKRIILAVVPTAWVNRIMQLVYSSELKKTKRVLEEEGEKGVTLSLEQLESISKEYPPVKRYGYSEGILKNRGEKRARNIYSLTKSRSGVAKTLEVGAQDGMISYFLNKNYGSSSTCIDLSPRPASLVNSSGIEFVKGSVNEMPFEDNLFDTVFSYNSFEHFHEPDLAIREMLRVVKPGGSIYLNFGPIYFAPKGLHLYNIMSVPYCQLLWKPETLVEYCRKHGLREPMFAIKDGLNGWSISQYRQLWEDISPIAEREIYHETPVYKHLDLVRKYPQCFRSKIQSPDDLIVTSIEMLIRKK